MRITTTIAVTLSLLCTQNASAYSLSEFASWVNSFTAGWQKDVQPDLDVIKSKYPTIHAYNNAYFEDEDLRSLSASQSNELMAYYSEEDSYELAPASSMAEYDDDQISTLQLPARVETSSEMYGYAYYRTEVRKVSDGFWFHLGDIFEDYLDENEDVDEDDFILSHMKQQLSSYKDVVYDTDDQPVKKFKDTHLVREDNKEYFKARLVDTSYANFNLDGVHFGDYYGDLDLYKHLQTIRHDAEQYLVKNSICGLKEGPAKTKLFAASKKALEDHVKKQFLKFQPADRHYAEDEIEVVRWSSVIRKLDEVGEGSGKWPHLDLNIEKNRSVYMAISFLADSVMTKEIESWKKSDIVYMMNLWTPLQDDPVGVPLAFFSKNRRENRAGLMHFQGTREMAFAPKILFQWQGDTFRTDLAPGFSVDKNDGMLTDAIGWIYKKDIKFGEYYLFDTRETLHSAFLTGGPKAPQAARLSTEFRFVILKKNR